MTSLGNKQVFEHQDLHMFGSKIKQKCVILTHLMLWIAAARHNIKWVEISNPLFHAWRVNVNVGGETLQVSQVRCSLIA